MTRAERHRYAKMRLLSAIAAKNREAVRVAMQSCLATAARDGIVRLVVAVDGGASDAAESAVRATLAANGDLIPIDKGFEVAAYTPGAPS